MFSLIILIQPELVCFLKRPFGRPCCALVVIGCGAFETFSEIKYGIEPYHAAFLWFHHLFPASYTFSEALVTFRAFMPLFLQASLIVLDNSFDVLPEKQDDPLKLLSAIVGKQEELIKEAEETLKSIKVERYGNEEVKLEDVLKENNEEPELAQLPQGL